MMPEEIFSSLEWPVGRIGDVAKVQSGFAFKSDWYTTEGVRLLRNANIHQSRIDWTEAVQLPADRRSEFADFELREGDIVLALDRPLVAAGLKVAQLTKGDLPALLVQRVGLFRLNGEIAPEFLFAFLNSPFFISQITGHDQSLGVPHVSPKQVEAVAIPLPPLGEQKRIAGILKEQMEAVERARVAAEAQLEAAKALPAAFLRDVFNAQDAGQNMRRSNCAGAMQYVPELTWILFLRILDERETQEAEAAEIVGAEFSASIDAPYRWQDWAAPEGPKRTELTGDGSRLGDLFAFVNGELLPYLKGLRKKAHATPQQKVISEILSGVERVRIDTEKNSQDVLDKVHELTSESIDDTHVFTLSQVYEGLLLKMGEKGGDGGQFFTPREVIRSVVQVVEPMIGETVYDPGCGTGGFLAQAYEFMAGKDNANIASPDDLDTLRHDTFFGREKENLIYPIALANLVLHGIDQPNLWHGNTLTRQETYDGLFLSAPPTFWSHCRDCRLDRVLSRLTTLQPELTRVWLLRWLQRNLVISLSQVITKNGCRRR